MSIRFIPMICLLISIFFHTAEARKRVAIIEFRGIKVEADILRQLTDDARGGMREGLPSESFDIISRENISQILAEMGKTIEDCSTECEISLGRDVGADYVLSGTIYKIEGVYILTLNSTTHLQAPFFRRKG